MQTNNLCSNRISKWNGALRPQSPYGAEICITLPINN